MNITAKVSEIREAVQNLNNITEGLRGLSDAIIPREKIDALIQPKLDTLINDVFTKCETAVATCDQTVGEAVQLFNTELSHYKARLERLEEQVSELVETLDTLANAATRKRRVKS